MNDADHALAARESDMPGLPLLLDEQALLQALDVLLPAADILRVRIDYLRYKPGTSCLAGLRVTDTLGRTQHAFARAETTTSPDWDWLSARMNKRTALDRRFSAHALPSVRLLLASAIHDRRITALGTLLNTPGTLGGTDPLPDDLGVERRLYEREIQAHVLRYKPERRMVLQLRQASRPVGVLRACTSRDFAATAAGARLAQAFQGTAPLAVGATRDFLVMPWLRGQALDAQQGVEIPRDGSGVTAGLPTTDLGLFADIGMRLGELQKARIDHPVQRSAADDIRAVAQAVDTIAWLQPELAGLARQLGEQTMAFLQQADAQWQPLLTHGDLSLEQMVRDPLGQLQFIDWDSAAWGDPMADAGSLMAHLAVQQLIRYRPALMPVGHPDAGGLNPPAASPLHPLEDADDGTDAARLPGMRACTPPTPASLASLLDRVHDALAEGIDAGMSGGTFTHHGTGAGHDRGARSTAARLRAGWHTVAFLLRLAPEGFRRHRTNWPQQMTHILELAEYLARALVHAGGVQVPAAGWQPSSPAAGEDATGERKTAHAGNTSDTSGTGNTGSVGGTSDTGTEGAPPAAASGAPGAASGTAGAESRTPDAPATSSGATADTAPHQTARHSGAHAAHPGHAPLPATAAQPMPASADTEPPPASAAEDPFAGWPQASRRVMEPLLLQTLQLPAADWTLQSIHVLRHKAGRRALLEYVLARTETGSTQTRPTETGLPQAGHTRTGHPRTGHVEAGHTHASHPKTGHSEAGHTQADHPETSGTQSGTSTRQVLLGKLRFKGVDHNGYAVQKALYEQGFDLPGLSVPEAVALLPQQRLWLQRKVGATMASQLITPDSDPALSFRIGRAIAALHRAGTALLEDATLGFVRRWTLSDELDMLHQRLEKAAEARPEWARRIRDLIPATSQLASRMPAHPQAGIHRDCYADQILVDGERMYWLDLDLFCAGDPALDVGNFVAHLMEDALRHHGRLDALQAHQDALVAGFMQDAPHIGLQAIHDWTLLSLARHVQLSTQFDDRHHTTLPLLQYCEQALSPLSGGGT